LRRAAAAEHPERPHQHDEGRILHAVSHDADPPFTGLPDVGRQPSSFSANRRPRMLAPASPDTRPPSGADPLRRSAPTTTPAATPPSPPPGRAERRPENLLRPRT